MLAGVSTRKFARVAEPVGSDVEATARSKTKTKTKTKTSVSEMFIDTTAPRSGS